MRLTMSNPIALTCFMLSARLQKILRLAGRRGDDGSSCSCVVPHSACSEGLGGGALPYAWERGSVVQPRFVRRCQRMRCSHAPPESSELRTPPCPNRRGHSLQI